MTGLMNAVSSVIRATYLAESIERISQMDTYDSLSLQSLIRAAYRITPANDADSWVITDRSKGQWTIGKEEMKLYKGGHIVDNMSFDDMRSYVVEQLEHYGVTTHQINRMQS